MKKFYNKLFKNTLTIALTVIISSAVIVAGIYAATTISANIVTDGNLTVSGRATTTSATTTDYLYIGPDGTENYFDFQGGDLYVRDDAEIDGNLYVTGISTLTGAVTMGATASVTDYIIIGNSVDSDDDLIYFDIGRTQYFGWDNSASYFTLSATASTTGNIFVSGGTIDVSTTTPTTTLGLFVRSHTTATSTLSIGSDMGDTSAGCIEMINSEGTYSHIYINGTTVTGQAGRCN